MSDRKRTYSIPACFGFSTPAVRQNLLNTDVEAFAQMARRTAAFLKLKAKCELEPEKVVCIRNVGDDRRTIFLLSPGEINLTEKDVEPLGLVSVKLPVFDPLDPTR